MAQDIRAVKVERSKKKADFLSKTGFFFDCLTLTALTVSQEPVVVQKRYIPHLKALKYSSYGPEVQGAWPTHITAPPP